MTTRATTEEHRTPTAEEPQAGAPAWILAFPEERAVPPPPVGAAVGRDYFAQHGRRDSEISGQHFRLSRAGGKLRIEDLGSRNGTWIDGHRIAKGSPAPLSDGALLRLGRSLFVVREELLGPFAPDPPVELPIGNLVGPWGLRAVRDALSRIRETRASPVLITGETGTGKELVSRAVAAALGRDKPFAAINVAALSKDLVEGNIFGWQRGAFTGADRSDPGLLRATDGGTVFLDEIAELPMPLQAKLLRVLEYGEILPVGGHQPIRVDVAFVAATNENIAERVSEKAFRTDLFARFRARIELPPLRDRPEDLLSLLVALWERQGKNRKADVARAHTDVEAMELLLLHDWPLNLRDLDRFATSLRGDAFELRLAAVRAWLGPAADAGRPPPPTRETLAEALAACGGNQLQAAKKLGVNRNVVLRLLEKHPDLRSPRTPRQ